MKSQKDPIGPYLFIPFGMFLIFLIVSVIIHMTHTKPPPTLARLVPKEPFCAQQACGGGGSASSTIDDISSDCDANRRDYVLGYEGAPIACPAVSPQWTYWYYPNILDHPCTDYVSDTRPEEPVPNDFYDIPAWAQSCRTEPSPFGFNPLPSAPTDCPVRPTPPYAPIGTDHLSIPVF